mgnify:CR=1 FL=1
MHNLYKILQELDSAKIHYTLGRYRDDFVTIHVTVPGQRIEIDVSSNGAIQTAVFSGNEDLHSGLEFVQNIIDEHSD